MGNEGCIKGHIGPLCEECDIYGEFWENSYGKIGVNTCLDCEESSMNIFFNILAIFWMIFYLSLTVKSSLNFHERKISN